VSESERPVRARPARARVQSLCGTSRGIASRKSASEKPVATRKPCRYAAIWACQTSLDCSSRMRGFTFRPHHSRG